MYAIRSYYGYNKKIAKEEKDREKFRTQEQLVIDAEEPVEDEDLPPVTIDDGEVLDHGHLPYIVGIVDELARNNFV